MINTFITLIYFVLILGVIILVHEFGHFIWAKKFGVFVHEFAIGMGPKIFSKKKGETVYSIRAIPVGGFCAMAGEDGEETDEKGKKIPRNRKFYAKPIWQRFLILFFGAGNNFILAFLFLFFVGLFGGAQIMDPVIGGVTKDYPVAIAGIEAGDEILEVNGHKTPTIDDVQLYITLNKVGSNLDLKIKDSEGNIKDYSIKPIKVEKDGVEGYYYGLEFKGEYENGFIAAIRFSFEKFGAILRQMVIVLGNLFTGGVSVNNFRSNVYKYNIIKYKLSTIDIVGIPNDEKSTVTVVPPTTIVPGDNSYIVTVTSENGNTKVLYQRYIFNHTMVNVVIQQNMYLAF